MAKSLNQSSSKALVADAAAANHILANINWNFSTPFSVGRSGTSLFDCRKYHWYPATFVPEIPYTLIEVLTMPGAAVLDPFAGIGTTIFQGILLGRRPYAVEISRVAVEFMRAMWLLLSPSTDLSRGGEFLQEVGDGYDAGKDYRSSLDSSDVLLDSLRPWYSEAAFNQVAYLILRERKCRHSIRPAMRIALSATLKAACAQDRGWGCIADRVLPKPDQLKGTKNVLQTFFRNVSTLVRDVQAVKETMTPDASQFLETADAETRIVRADIRQCTSLRKESIDIVVTSPPYPNMTDYSLAQRLSYYWLGEDPAEDLALEIGARRKRSRPDPIGQYLEGMRCAIKVICDAIKPGGYACFVMPSFESDTQNNDIRKQAIQDCLSSVSGHGLVLEQTLCRILPMRRRQHNQKWASLTKEGIHVFRKRP